MLGDRLEGCESNFESNGVNGLTVGILESLEDKVESFL